MKTSMNNPRIIYPTDKSDVADKIIIIRIDKYYGH